MYVNLTRLQDTGGCPSHHHHLTPPPFPFPSPSAVVRALGEREQCIRDHLFYRPPPKDGSSSGDRKAAKPRTADTVPAVQP